MKKLIIILGPNGVGKSTVATELMHMLPNSAFIDSDSLRMMNPPGNSVELIQIQKANILAVMSNYFSAAIIEYVIFPYGLHGHRKAMLKDIIRDIYGKFDVEICTIVLICSEEENVRRMKLDGRDTDRIKRAVEVSRREYDNIENFKIDITSLTPKETALNIIDVFKLKQR